LADGCFRFSARAASKALWEIDLQGLQRLADAAQVGVERENTVVAATVEPATQPRAVNAARPIWFGNPVQGSPAMNIASPFMQLSPDAHPLDELSHSVLNQPHGVGGSPEPASSKSTRKSP